jgi:hypothetical protein
LCKSTATEVSCKKRKKKNGDYFAKLSIPLTETGRNRDHRSETRRKRKQMRKEKRSIWFEPLYTSAKTWNQICKKKKNLKLANSKNSTRTENKIPWKRKKKTLAKIYEKILECAKSKATKVSCKKRKRKKRRLLRKTVNDAH